MARRAYREGRFGEFKLGTACLLEKWYYRDSNFQNWMTAENSDAFTYIGCHYVDLVAFITGLLPVSVSVYGILDRFPNGKEGYLWTDARVIWNNGACLNVQNALGFPDAAPGTNTQGLTMYCKGANEGAWLAHSDQYRGLQYCYTGAGRPTTRAESRLFSVRGYRAGRGWSRSGTDTGRSRASWARPSRSSAGEKTLDGDRCRGDYCDTGEQQLQRVGDRGGAGVDCERRAGSSLRRYVATAAGCR